LSAMGRLATVGDIWRARSLKLALRCATWQIAINHGLPFLFPSSDIPIPAFGRKPMAVQSVMWLAHLPW
ncbi:MAG: hypothetical protein WBP37_05905, partial [Candidatus Dechloromonas phosphoritropha]